MKTEDTISYDWLTDELMDFSPVDLYEINQAKLMRRIDRKYILPRHLLPGLLRELSGYSILEIDERRNHTYKTYYYDTRDLVMYNEHHNQKRGRFKVRRRKYMTTGEQYLEIKFKNNKGITTKKRMQDDTPVERFCLKGANFITRNTKFHPLSLQYQMFNSFNRFTLLGPCKDQRITFDTELYFKRNGYVYDLSDLAIIEVKYDKFLSDNLIMDVLQNRKIFPQGFSKYCMGMVLTDNGVKNNLFKSKVQYLNRLINYNRYGNLGYI